MGCNCGKNKVNVRRRTDVLKNNAFGTKIKKIWKLSENNGIVVKKINKQ